jgi:hypothetical protein
MNSMTLHDFRLRQQQTVLAFRESYCSIDAVLQNSDDTLSAQTAAQYRQPLHLTIPQNHRVSGFHSSSCQLDPFPSSGEGIFDAYSVVSLRKS